MTVEFKSGDILSADVEALINPVNCVGVMGKGLALQFKNAFPENYGAYCAAYRKGELHVGRMFVHEHSFQYSPPYIINFPTKKHWRSKSRMEDIDSGLIALAAEIRLRKIKSIAIPALGCGLGGLDWAEVRPKVEAAMGEFEDLKAVIFEPEGRE